MIEKTTARRITLEAYGAETWPDQIVLSPPTTPVGNTTWRGMCTPSITVFYSSENDGSMAGVGSRLIFFNSLTPDGLTLDVDIKDMRVIDPATMYAGPFSGSIFYGSTLAAVTLDWGDGSTPETFDMAPADAEPAPQHTYASAGTYSVMATVVFTDSGYTAIGGAPSVTLDVVIQAP